MRYRIGWRTRRVNPGETRRLLDRLAGVAERPIQPSVANPLCELAKLDVTRRIEVGLSPMRSMTRFAPALTKRCCARSLAGVLAHR